LVDSTGLVSAVVIHEGNIADRDGAKLLLDKASAQVDLDAARRGAATLPARIHRVAKKVDDRENLRVDLAQP
jgi:hypothetical protein